MHPLVGPNNGLPPTRPETSESKQWQCYIIALEPSFRSPHMTVPQETAYWLE